MKYPLVCLSISQCEQQITLSQRGLKEKDSQLLQKSMMAEKPMDLKVAGVEGGTVENSYAAGIVHDGMGNTNHGSRAVSVKGNVGNILSGDYNRCHVTTTQGVTGPAVQKKDPLSLTSSELLEKLRHVECSEETVKRFSEKKVTGRLFMDLDDDLLQDLNITDNIEKRRLRSLHKDLRTGQ